MRSVAYNSTMIKLEHRSIELLWTLSLMLLFGIMLKLGDLTVDTGNCAQQDWVCQIGFLFLPGAQIVALMGVIVPLMKAGGKYWNVNKDERPCFRRQHNLPTAQIFTPFSPKMRRGYVPPERNVLRIRWHIVARRFLDDRGRAVLPVVA